MKKDLELLEDALEVITELVELCERPVDGHTVRVMNRLGDAIRLLKQEN